MVVMTAVAFTLGDGIAPMALVAFGLLIVVINQGVRMGVLWAGAMVILAAVLMEIVYRRPAEFIIAQAAVLLVLFGVVLLFAALVRMFSAAAFEAQAAGRRLAASLENEKELVLAEERARAAAELHDGLGHRLTAIGFLLDAALQRRTTSSEASWELVGEARAATSEAVQEMRTWVRALHPLPLGKLSDAEVFRGIADRFRGTDLEVTVNTNVRELTREQALVVYRCVQEGLTNVVRHAGARRVELRVHQTGEVARVELADDGCGRGDAGEGFGLGGLRRRVEDLGGTLESIDPPEGGHRLVVKVPA